MQREELERHQLVARQRVLAREVLGPLTGSTITLTRSYQGAPAEFRRLVRTFEAIWLTSVKGYRCAICRMPTRGRWQLRKHLRTFHGITYGR